MLFPDLSVLMTVGESHTISVMRLPTVKDLQAAMAPTQAQEPATGGGAASYQPTLDLGCRELAVHWKPITKAASLVRPGCLWVALRVVWGPCVGVGAKLS